MVFEHRDYRNFLKTALAERAKTRDGYSLRAFAEKVGISNSFLSEVLGAKKSLSMELAFRIAIRLELTEAETQYFCLLVQLDQEKDPTYREEILRRLGQLNPTRPAHDLSVDLFRIIADWHHYAILELTYLTGLCLSAATAAKKLGITKVEAELAIERLVRLELLEKSEDGGFRKSPSYVIAQSPIPNGALKQFHRQILEKAIESLQSQTPAERTSATDILPIDSKYLPEVDRLSREFSSAVLGLSEKSKIKDSVYALAVHFFKLSHEGK